VAYGGALVLLAGLSSSGGQSLHTSYRTFGTSTLMLYDSYPAAIDAAARLIWKHPAIYVHLLNGKPLLPSSPVQLEMIRGELPGEETYEQSVLSDLAERVPLDAGDPVPLGLSHHVWVRYSDRNAEPGRIYHQVLAAGHLAPASIAGFARRSLPDGWVLFYRPDKSIFARIDIQGQ
jgi:hypothetical protein